MASPMIAKPKMHMRKLPVMPATLMLRVLMLGVRRAGNC